MFLLDKSHLLIPIVIYITLNVLLLINQAVYYLILEIGKIFEIKEEEIVN